jgi:YD repeat-containing protein
MNSWQTHIASDGKTISVFYGGLKVTYTSQGSISEVVFLGEDGTESDTKYIYNYNDNGYLTSITRTKASGWSSEFVTIEYTN